MVYVVLVNYGYESFSGQDAWGIRGCYTVMANIIFTPERFVVAIFITF